jgi:hypothetical protein
MLRAIEVYVATTLDSLPSRSPESLGELAADRAYGWLVRYPDEVLGQRYRAAYLLGMGRPGRRDDQWVRLAWGCIRLRGRAARREPPAHLRDRYAP